MPVVYGAEMGRRLCEILHLDCDSMAGIELTFKPNQVVTAVVRRFVTEKETGEVMELLENHQLSRCNGKPEGGGA